MLADESGEDDGARRGRLLRRLNVFRSVARAPAQPSWQLDLPWMAEEKSPRAGRAL